MGSKFGGKRSRSTRAFTLLVHALIIECLSRLLEKEKKCRESLVKNNEASN